MQFRQLVLKKFSLCLFSDFRRINMASQSDIDQLLERFDAGQFAEAKRMVSALEEKECMGTLTLQLVLRNNQTAVHFMMVIYCVCLRKIGRSNCKG